MLSATKRTRDCKYQFYKIYFQIITFIFKYIGKEIVQINDVEYTTYSYGHLKKCNDFFISFQSGNTLKFGKILKIFKADARITFKVEVFQTAQLHYNLFEYFETNNITAYVNADSNIKKCLNLQSNNKNYLCVLHFILIVD